MRGGEERPHPPGGAGWQEAWSFDFVDPAGALAGFVGLTLDPSTHLAWYWACVGGAGRSLVVVRDHEVEPPRTRELEVRAPGLWAQLICETPFDHWSAGLEALAVAVDGRDLAAGDERGDPVPLGLDLEWEMTGAPGGAGAGGYVQPAAVAGEVLVGPERLTVDGTGWYRHRWGTPPAGGAPWWWLGAHLADGSAVSASAPGRGTVWAPAGGPPVDGPAGLETGWGPDGLPESGRASVGALEVELAPLVTVPLPLGGPGGDVLVRVMGRFGPGGDGRGWAEWLRGRDGSRAEAG